MQPDLYHLPKSHSTFSTGPDRIYWWSETSQGVFDERACAQLLEKFTNPIPIGKVLDQIEPERAREAAAFTIVRMIRSGLIEAASVDSIPPNNGNSELAALQETRRFEPNQVTISGLQIFFVHDYLDPALKSIHQDQLQSSTPWMLARIGSRYTWAGPVFDPPGTPCWRCLAARLRETRWVESQLPASVVAGRRTAFDRAPAAIAKDFIHAEAAAWSRGSRELSGAVRTLCSSTLERQLHHFRRRSQCAACGTPGPFNPESLKPVSRPLASERSAGPAEVIEKLGYLVSPVTGIVPEVRSPELKGAIWSCQAVHLPALPPRSLRPSGVILAPGTCSGRGLTAEEAYAACLAEAVERYSMQFRGDEPRMRGTFDDLQPLAVDPEAALLFSDSQYRNRLDWNASHKRSEAVPERFDPSESIEWAIGYSLTHDEPRYLPMAACYLGYRPAGTRWIADADSNGCAAASSFEEAILEALYELIERDARAIWWYNRVSLPPVEPASLEDPVLRDACAQLAAEGWRVYVQNLTHDIGVPVFGAIAQRNGEWVHGFGSHSLPLIALRRAVAELAQLAGEKPRAGSPPPPSSWVDTTGHLTEQWAAVDALQVIGSIRKRLESAGLEVIVLRLTRDDLGLDVARVVVPGLRHIKPRFAAGRLYEVPVRMGWLTESCTESDLPPFAP